MAMRQVKNAGHLDHCGVYGLVWEAQCQITVTVQRASDVCSFFPVCKQLSISYTAEGGKSQASSHEDTNSILDPT